MRKTALRRCRRVRCPLMLPAAGCNSYGFAGECRAKTENSPHSMRTANKKSARSRFPVCGLKLLYGNVVPVLPHKSRPVNLSAYMRVRANARRRFTRSGWEVRRPWRFSAERRACTGNTPPPSWGRRGGVGGLPSRCAACSAFEADLAMTGGPAAAAPFFGFQSDIALSSARVKSASHKPRASAISPARESVLSCTCSLLL